MNSLMSFSNEILEFVLRHLKSNEIYKTSLVSRRINEIVSSSTFLMGKLEVEWTRAKDYQEVPTKSRKYRRLEIKNVNEMSLSLGWFIKVHSQTLAFVSVDKCAFKMSELHFMLKQVAPTLLSLQLYNTNVLELCKMPKVEMKRLDHLVCKNSSDCDLKFMFSLVKSNKLNTLKFYGVVKETEFTSEDLLSLVNFIEAQKALKTVILPPVVSEMAVNYWIDEKPCSIELTRIELEISDRQPARNCPKLWEFLESQQKSLEALRLDNFKLEDKNVKQLQRSKLKKLIFNNCKFEWCKKVTKNHSIEELHFKNQTMDDFQSRDAVISMLNSCKGLKTLGIGFLFEEKEILHFPMNFLVEKLDIRSVYFLERRKYPIKSIALRDTEFMFKYHIIRFVAENSQLESLEFHKVFKEDKEFRKAMRFLVPAAVITYKNMDTY